jgi:hypothetical protein
MLNEIWELIKSEGKLNYEGSILIYKRLGRETQTKNF